VRTAKEQLHVEGNIEKWYSQSNDSSEKSAGSNLVPRV
jgi:hypothetical protein